MAVDGSAYGNQRLTNFDIAGSLQKAEDRKLKQKLLAEDEAIKSAYQRGVVQNPDGTTSFNADATLSQLMSVNPQKGLEFKRQLDQEKALNQKAQFEKINQQADFLGRAAAQLRTSGGQGYEAMMQQAKASGFDTSMMPPMYGPDAQQKLDFFAGQALTVKDQLEQKFKQEDYGMKSEKHKADLAKTYAETRKLKSESGGSGGTVKMTEAQSKSLGFGRRALIADQMLEKVMSDPNADVTSLKTQLKSSLPKYLGGAKSPQEQTLNTAKLGFISAVLRKESGAAVTPEEFSQYDKIYFPQPGDSPQTSEEKRVLRANFIDTEKLTAGNAWRDPIQSAAVKSTGPKVGAVESGYRFKGGNPSDPNSWEKL